MPCAHDRAVILIIKRRGAKINQINLRTEQYSPELRTPGRERAR